MCGVDVTVAPLMHSEQFREFPNCLSCLVCVPARLALPLVSSRLVPLACLLRDPPLDLLSGAVFCQMSTRMVASGQLFAVNHSTTSTTAG